jgi:hypothetical protein
MAAYYIAASLFLVSRGMPFNNHCRVINLGIRATLNTCKSEQNVGEQKSSRPMLEGPHSTTGYPDTSPPTEGSPYMSLPSSASPLSMSPSLSHGPVLALPQHASVIQLAPLDPDINTEFTSPYFRDSEFLNGIRKEGYLTKQGVSNLISH